MALLGGALGVWLAFGALALNAALTRWLEGLPGTSQGLSGWLPRGQREVLYGLSATDPLTFATVGAALTIVAVAASYVPARRAGGWIR